MSTSVTLDGQALLTWVTLLVAVVGAVVAVGRWIVKSLDTRVRGLHERMEAEVQRATVQIQPTANGGGSLPDISRAVHRLAEANEAQHERIHQRIDLLGADVKDLQLWASDRPCLLDVEARAARARQRLRQQREAGSNDDAECPVDDA